MSSLFFDLEKVKTFSEAGVRKQQKILKHLDQVGKSDKYLDERRKALPSGKRVSKSGKVYWETRKNRSDKEGSNI